MTPNGKTQKLITIDPTLWRHFRARCDLEGVTITELLERVLSGFLKIENNAPKNVKQDKPMTVEDIAVNKAETGLSKKIKPVEEPDRPALDAEVKEPAPEKPNRPHPEDMEPAAEPQAKIPTRKDRYRGKKDPEQTATMDKHLLKYAKHFSIPTEGKAENLLDQVLDAIEGDYKGKKKDLGKKQFSKYLDENRGMLEWFNDNRG